MRGGFRVAGPEEAQRRATLMLWLKMLLFPALFVGFFVVVVPYMIAGGGPVMTRTQGPWQWPSWLVLLIGAAMCARCVWDFAATGRGTPAPFDPPRQLVAVGLYRVVRDPMVVGFLIILAGEVLLFRSVALLGYAVLMAVCLHLFVILHEEPTLRRHFGASYDRYCGAVRRWLPGRAYRKPEEGPIGR